MQTLIGAASRGGATPVPAGANEGDFTPLTPRLFSPALLQYRQKMGTLGSFCGGDLGSDNSSVLPSAQSTAKARSSSV